MKRFVTLAAAAVLAATLAACDGDSVDDAIAPTLDGETSEAALIETPDVVGMLLDEAEDALETAGITDVTSEDIQEGKGIWMKSNWTVVEQRNDGDTVWLGVTDTAVNRTDDAAPIDEAAPADEPAQPQADLVTRSAELEQAIKNGLGVDDFAELLVVDATMWGGYINGVEIDQFDNAYITLQITGDDPDREEMGSRAARALSTLLTANAVENINWLIVQDASRVVIAQEMPAPIM